MNRIEADINSYVPLKGQLAVYWLGGAGFIIKSRDKTVGIDLFLTDSVHNGDDYKRLIPSPVAAENLQLDLLIASHEHGDHTDIGCIQTLVRKDTILLGPESALQVAEHCGVPRDSMQLLCRGDKYYSDGIHIRAVMADHGDLSPQAIGVIMTIDGITIYFTGDTCYHTNYCEMIDLQENIDMLIVPINSTFGNPGPDGAAYIASCVGAKTVLPCHYWLFREHGGDPGSFLESCARIIPQADARVLAIGERFVYGIEGSEQ